MEFVHGGLADSARDSDACCAVSYHEFCHTSTIILMLPVTWRMHSSRCRVYLQVLRDSGSALLMAAAADLDACAASAAAEAVEGASVAAVALPFICCYAARPAADCATLLVRRSVTFILEYILEAVHAADNATRYYSACSRAPTSASVWKNCMQYTRGSVWPAGYRWRAAASGGSAVNHTTESFLAIHIILYSVQDCIGGGAAAGGGGAAAALRAVRGGAGGGPQAALGAPRFRLGCVHELAVHHVV